MRHDLTGRLSTFVRTSAIGSLIVWVIASDCVVGIDGVFFRGSRFMRFAWTILMMPSTLALYVTGLITDKMVCGPEYLYCSFALSRCHFSSVASLNVRLGIVRR